MPMAAQSTTGWTQAMRVYFTRRQLVILAMGFASGLPLLLTLSTLSFWLSKLGVDKTTIGLFALVGSPYTFKFAWSPIIDQAPVPVLTRLLGRRRSWLLVLQIGLAAAIYGMGQTDPVAAPTATALMTILVAFFAASQDIVIDAYRIELLDDDEQGAGAGTTQVGYRIGMLVAGAGAVAMSDFVSWPVIFSILAGVMVLCALSTLLIPEPKEGTRQPRRDGSYRDWIKDAVIRPFADFIGRRGWVVILLFILFYKFGDAFGGTMATPFYNELGFTGTEIAAMSKVYGLMATLVGGVMGGVVVARIGLFRALLIGGVLQAVTNLLFSYLAVRGNDLLWLGVAITADNLAGGVAAAAFVAYLSGLCNIAFTATQYALLTSFMAQGRTVMSSGSGWLADHLNWIDFWALTALMAVPGLLFLLWIARLYPHGLANRRD
jgi:PAT family beta-lactamase induction signal transducer AmpG